MIMDYLTHADLPNAQKIADECWKHNSDAHPNLAEDLFHEEAMTYAVRLQGMLIGFGGYRPSAISRHVFQITVDAIWPPYQGQGYGRALMKRRLYDIMVEGGKWVLLTTELPEVYEHFGFRTVMDKDNNSFVRDLWAPSVHLMALDVRRIPRSLLSPAAMPPGLRV